MRNKTWLSAFVAVIMLFTLLLDSNAAMASNTSPSQITVHENNVVEWNKRYTFIDEPMSYVSNDKVLYVYIQSMNDAFNLDLVYDKSSKTLINNKAKNHMSLPLGSKTMVHNGKNLMIKHPVTNVKGDIYIPLEVAEILVNGKVKHVNYVAPLLPDKLASDSSNQQVMKQRVNNMSKALQSFEQAAQNFINASNENLYDISGLIRPGFKNTTLWGTADALSNHVTAHLTSDSNIVILNPNKKNVTGDRYNGQHYFVKRGTATDVNGNPTFVYYFGGPSKAIQNNMAAKKKAMEKAANNINTLEKQNKATVVKWVDSVKKHYNAKGGAKNPQVLSKMVIHFHNLYETTEIAAFKTERDKLHKQLNSISQFNYWLVDSVINDDQSFDKRFTALLAKDMGAAMSTVKYVDDYKIAAEKLYARKRYAEAMDAALIAKANGVDMEGLINKIHGQWVDPYEESPFPEDNKEELEAERREQEQERIKQENEEKRIKQEQEQERIAFEKWVKDYKALLVRYNQDFNAKYGNLEYVNGLTYQQRSALAQEIATNYKQPLVALETQLLGFKHESIDAMKENLGNMRSSIEQLTTLGDEERTRIAAAHLDLAMFTAGLIE